MNVWEVLNELMGVACFGLAVGLLLAAKPLGLSEGIAGPATGGLVVASGLCFVAAAVGLRRPRDERAGQKPDAT